MPIGRLLLWVLSALAFVLLAYTLWIEPLPLWLTVAWFVIYAGYSTIGVLYPQLEMYGDVLWRLEAQGIALTFDDGPHPETTRTVLTCLAQSGHKATFFVIGQKVEKYPDVLREIVEQGHAVGLHGYSHDRLYSLRSPNFVHEDILRARRAVERACGLTPTLFRPPIAYMSHRTIEGARRAGVTPVAHSARGLDGLSRARPERVLSRILTRLRPGTVVLLHDAAEREDFIPAGVLVLPAILSAIRERGLETLKLDAHAPWAGKSKTKRAPAV